jgi:hypothetical protein
VLVVGLLIAALVCLCIGLLLSSAPWLIGSLAASVLAALLIYRNRAVFAMSRPARTAPDRTAPRAAAGKHARDAGEAVEALEAVEAVAAPPVAGRPDPDVWVVDGRPRYHREGCQIIDEQDAETIPLSQADEDGFIPCSLCEPDRVDHPSNA